MYVFFSRHCLTKQISWKWTALSGSPWLVDTNSRGSPSKRLPVEWHCRTMIHMMCKATCMNRANTHNYLYISYLYILCIWLSVRVSVLLPKSIIGKPELHDFLLTFPTTKTTIHLSLPEVKNHPMPWWFLRRSSSLGAPIDTDNVVQLPFRENLWRKNGYVRDPQHQMKKPSDLKRIFGHHS